MNRMYHHLPGASFTLTYCVTGDNQFNLCDSIVLSLKNNISDPWVIEESMNLYLYESQNWEEGLQYKLERL